MNKLRFPDENATYQLYKKLHALFEECGASPTWRVDLSMICSYTKFPRHGGEGYTTPNRQNEQINKVREQIIPFFGVFIPENFGNILTTGKDMPQCVLSRMKWCL